MLGVKLSEGKNFLSKIEEKNREVYYEKED